MDNMRILKGYSEEERKELEEAKDNCFYSVIALICSIDRDDDDCHALYEKYYLEDTNGNNQMARDIADYYAGVAKFPEQKYVVHDTNTNSVIYHDDINNKLIWAPLCFYLPAKKTKDEWLEINPAYESMLEKVEDDE